MEFVNGFRMTSHIYIYISIYMKSKIKFIFETTNQATSYHPSYTFQPKTEFVDPKKIARDFPYGLLENSTVHLGLHWLHWVHQIRSRKSSRFRRNSEYPQTRRWCPCVR